jgi:predicted glycoside hydrolase/deacetylase ChbG (UPF0249 family)
MANTRLHESREIELHVLTMPEVRELLSNSGIDLVSYAEFVTDKAVP